MLDWNRQLDVAVAGTALVLTAPVLVMPTRLELAVRGVERQSVLHDLVVLARTALAFGALARGE